jgi:RNase P subunit RPR2
MKDKLSKSQAKKVIEEFFKDIKNKTPKDIKKIKRLAMSKNIPLKEKRKLFCKKCLTPYKSPKTRIKNKIKSVECANCEYVSRWKLI